METALWAIGLMFISTWIAAFGSLYLKKASATLTSRIFQNLKNKYLYYGFILFGFGSLLYFVSLANGELSVIYPLASLTYIWISIISMKFLDERMNKYKWSGIILIMIGVTLLGLGMG